MGISWSSNNRRRQQNHHHHHHPPPSQLLSSSSYPPPQFAAPPPPYPYHTHPPPPPQQPPGYSPYPYPGGYPMPNYQYPVMGQSNFGGWIGGGPRMVGPPAHQPAAFVEEQQAKKVMNYVNVHKDTLKFEVDEKNPDQYLLTFVFDALFDGSITIFYFAKEEPNCKVVPVLPESYTPVKVPFLKGAGQKFRQPSGTGIYLGSLELDDLTKPAAGDVFPLVISAETCLPSLSIDENSSDRPNSTPHRQITQAVLQKNEGDPFKVRVIKQILWIDDVRYELREIYGIGNSTESVSNSDSGKECVICLTEPRNTAVLPCRHMCLCSECAKLLRLQSNKCPICRQPIEELMEIKIDDDDDQ